MNSAISEQEINDEEVMKRCHGFELEHPTFDNMLDFATAKISLPYI